VLIGDDVPVGADHKTGSGLVAGFLGLGRRWRRCGRRLGSHRNDDGKIPGARNAQLFHLGHAVHQRWQQLRGLIELELEQLALRIGRHPLCLAELRNQRRIVRHRHTDQLIGDRNTVNVERRLAIECQRDRERLPGRQLPIFVANPGPSRPCRRS